jgi:hypothetical protein
MPPKLLGTYRTPEFVYGDVVKCAVRGKVVIVDLSDAPIRWPIGRARAKVGNERCRRRGLILCGDLAEAVRRESQQAVMYFWGVGQYTAWQWRKALGVGAVTEGTSRLKSGFARGPGVAAGRAKAADQARDADKDAARREKIAASKRGKDSGAGGTGGAGGTTRAFSPRAGVESCRSLHRLASRCRRSSSSRAARSSRSNVLQNAKRT